MPGQFAMLTALPSPSTQASERNDEPLPQAAEHALQLLAAIRAGEAGSTMSGWTMLATRPPESTAAMNMDSDIVLVISAPLRAAGTVPTR